MINGAGRIIFFEKSRDSDFDSMFLVLIMTFVNLLEISAKIWYNVFIQAKKLKGAGLWNTNYWEKQD